MLPQPGRCSSAALCTQRCSTSTDRTCLHMSPQSSLAMPPNTRAAAFERVIIWAKHVYGMAQHCRDSHLMESLAGLVPRQPLHTRFFQLGTMVVKYAGDAKRLSCASRACRAVKKRPLQEFKRETCRSQLDFASNLQEQARADTAAILSVLDQGVCTSR